MCSERIYDTAKFYGRVAHFPFDDHHPPKFEEIKPFCDDVTKWLQQNQKNVAVVHCKAGKGRTGLAIASYMIFMEGVADAYQAIEFFNARRTTDNKGLKIPS